MPRRSKIVSFGALAGKRWPKWASRPLKTIFFKGSFLYVYNDFGERDR